MVALILPRNLDKKAYRLRCRFKIEPCPSIGRLDIEKVRVAERFVEDMRKQGWTHDPRFDFRLLGPFVPVVPVALNPRRTPTARQMLPGVLAGKRFLDDGATEVRNVPLLGESDYWEYEIAAVFVRTQVLTETADPHEERLSW